jgi:hypothetical protein
LKFFTLQWWFDESFHATPEALSVFQKYDEHLKAIDLDLATLPEFVRNPSGLHDFELKSMVVERNSVVLTLINPDKDSHQSLKISGVSACSKVYGSEDTPKYESECIGYHELDLDTDASTLILSIICNTSAELTMTCSAKDFDVQLFDT